LRYTARIVSGSRVAVLGRGLGLVLGLMAFASGCATGARASRARPPVVVRASAARTAPREARFPSRGCTPSAPVVQGFAPRSEPLDALEAAAETPANDPVAPFADGPVRAEFPAPWWPSRVEGRDFTAYRWLTGEPSDAITLYVGDHPAFSAPGGHEFRLALAGTLLRGTLSRQDRRWRLEALALLPCASPRHVHVSARSDDPRVIARVARALRSLRVTREPGERPGPIPLEASRDRPRVDGWLRGAPEPLRQWALSALDAGALRARYALAVDHPLADQTLFGRVSTSVRGLPADVWLHLPVRAGAAVVEPVFSDAASAGALPARWRDARCANPSLTIAQDGVALRCEGEPEWRAALREDDGAHSMTSALDRALAGRDLVRRWAARPALAWEYPASLCDPTTPDASRAPGAPRAPRASGAPGVSGFSGVSEPAVVTGVGAATSIRWGRCLLLAREQAGSLAISGLAVEGECARIPDAPWSRGMRSAGRFTELGAGTGDGACRFTLGLREGRGWVVSTSDRESAAGPVGQGLSMGVSRDAIARAIGVAMELASMSAGRRDDPPEGVTPEVLAGLGVDRPGSARARETARRWYAFGGVDGALPVALFDAGGADRVRVSVAAWTLEVTRGADGRWTVTAVEPTAW
jgi:hypothetical protein